MKTDLWPLYYNMYKARLFEEAVVALWKKGKISGEMHCNLGEEAIFAGILDHLTEGDSLAVDHRGTAPMFMRGVDPVLLLKEFLGHSDGLCRGMGGHMHLFSKELKISSSGIVGASGPSAAGFALASKYMKEKNVAISFSGEGSMNQGMMMESMNLAGTWKLPVIFVCKDNDMAITTVSSDVTAGKHTDRARGYGIPSTEIDGTDIEKVWSTAEKAVSHARQGKGPFFIHAHCYHLEGHFLGDPLLRITREPGKELKEIAGPLLKSSSKMKGAGIHKRAQSLASVVSVLGKTATSGMFKKKDPIVITRKKLKKEKERLDRT
jgi:TPP-dependent pyruvate/acetoin dehydrogenase alpha subunit